MDQAQFDHGFTLQVLKESFSTSQFAVECRDTNSMTRKKEKSCVIEIKKGPVDRKIVFRLLSLYLIVIFMSLYVEPSQHSNVFSMDCEDYP